MLDDVSPHIFLTSNPKNLDSVLRYLNEGNFDAERKTSIEIAVVRNCGHKALPSLSSQDLGVFNKITSIPSKIACHLVETLTIDEVRKHADLIVRHDVLSKFHLLYGYIDKSIVTARIAKLKIWPTYWTIVEKAYSDLLEHAVAQPRDLSASQDLIDAYLCGFPLENGFPTQEWLAEYRALRRDKKAILIEKLKTETELWLAAWPCLLNDEDLSQHAPLSSFRIIDLYCYTDGTKSHVFSRNDVEILLEKKTNPWTTIAIPDDVIRIFAARYQAASKLPSVSLIEEL